MSIWRGLKMSKKLLVVMVIILLVLPVSVFAIDLIGLKVGPAAMMNGSLDPEAADYIFGNDEISVEDFTFGADVRMNLSIVEVNALALVTSLNEDFTAVDLDLYTNAGLSISLMNFLKVGASVGPMFTAHLGDTSEIDGIDDDPMDWGLNLRLTADVELGDLSVGASAIFDTDVMLGDVVDGETSGFEGLFDNPTGLFGVSALFAIF